MQTTLPKLTPEQAEAMKQKGAEILKAQESKVQESAAAKSQPTPEDTEDVEEPISPLQQYLADLPDADRALYATIRKELTDGEQVMRLLVSGQLTYTFDLKGMPVVFKLLNGRDKYLVDQYRYGADPLEIFKKEIDAAVTRRMQEYEEERAEARKNYLDMQSIDLVGKRAILVTLALSISTFNSKQLGEPEVAVVTIENFQAPLIQKLHQVYSIFETVVLHLLNDEDFLKN